MSNENKQSGERAAVSDAMLDAAQDAFNGFPCPDNGSVGRNCSDEQMRAVLAAAMNARATQQATKGDEREPVPMLLFCPACGTQHVDAPSCNWTNPPHRSHLCNACGCVWRPADIPTTGVESIETHGSADHWDGPGAAAAHSVAGSARQAALNLEHTPHGFAIIKFNDRYGVLCSLQASSLATEAAIWFGCDDANPRVLNPGNGWKPVEMPPEYIADTRMHLTQDQVAALLPALQHFAETGEVCAAPTAPSLTTDAGAVLTSDQHNAIEVALVWVPPSCPEVHEVLRALLAAHPTEQRMGDAELEQFIRMEEQFSDCNETDVDHTLLLKWVRDGLLDCTHYVVTDKGNAVLDAARKAEIERSGGDA